MEDFLIEERSWYFQPEYIPTSSGSTLKTTNVAYCFSVIAFSFLNILGKCFNTIVLHGLQNNRGMSTGLLLSLHLCYCEMFINVLTVIVIGIHVTTNVSITEDGVSDNDEPLFFIILAVVLVFVPVLYCVKFFIMMTSVLKVHLNTLYEVYWDLRKTKIALLITWVCAVTTFLTTSILCLQCQLTIIYRYLFIPGAFIFVVYAIATNTYLLYKLHWSRIPPPGSTTVANENTVVVHFFKLFLKSQFVEPVMISMIFSLFLISAASEAVNVLVTWHHSDSGREIQMVTLTSFDVMVLADTLVSLFMEPQVRRYISNTLRRWRDRRIQHRESRIRGTSNSSTPSHPPNEELFTIELHEKGRSSPSSEEQKEEESVFTIELYTKEKSHSPGEVQNEEESF